MAYMNADDISDGATERLIYFTIDENTPITPEEISVINESFAPMNKVTAKGLINQDGKKICLIPISSEFLTNIAEPEEVTPQTMLRYEALAYRFDYYSVSDSCVISLSSVPQKYEDVNIKWSTLSEGVTITDHSDDGYFIISINANGKESIRLTLELSIFYAEGDKLLYRVDYLINIS